MKAAGKIGFTDTLSGHPGSLTTGIAGLSASTALPARHIAILFSNIGSLPTHIAGLFVNIFLLNSFISKLSVNISALSGFMFILPTFIWTLSGLVKNLKDVGFLLFCLILHNFPMINGGFDRHPLNRPAGTFSPMGEKAGMRGRADDSTVYYWKMVTI